MYDLHSLALIIVCAPLLGGIITGLLLPKTWNKAAYLTCCSLVALSFFVCCYVLYGFVTDQYQTWNENVYVWGEAAQTNFCVGFLCDKLSILMVTVVSFVALMVHIYSIGYMQDDPGFNRFFCYISLFTFAMLMLVLANNFMQLFFGWEGVGLMSYLLIGFWYTRSTAIYAGLKAFIINRIGDLGFILGIAAIYKYYGSLDYTAVFALNSSTGVNTNTIDLICMCLFIGAMAKSAQIPLHVWLPDSMEGPTPISALIHAATMVTAGVFMVARMSPLFEYSDFTLSFITIIGALTALLLGMVAIVQSDIKRIIAYSTISQLGYMVTALGVSAYAASILHLVTHAFFKSILFLAAGSVILALHHEQNIFKMGGLKNLMPITFATMLIATLSMIGIPGMAGFYSKDLIIDAVAKSDIYGANFAYIALTLSVLITAIYSFRLLFIVFYGNKNEAAAHAHESAKVIWIPLVLLAIPAIVSGGLLIGKIVHNFFGNAIYVLPSHDVISEISATEFQGAIYMFVHSFTALPVWLAFAGFAIAWICYHKYPQIPDKVKLRCGLIYKILIAKFGFDRLYETIIMPMVQFLARSLWNYGDIKTIDGVVNGSAAGVSIVATQLKKIQTGYLYQYTFVMIAAIFLLLVWFFVY